MDYISREKLRQAMYHEAFETDTDLQKWESGCWIRYKLFENVIDALPAADVEECKVGKWEKYGEDMQVCSVCNKYWIWAGEMYDFKYCPNCGAKMEG